VFVCITEDETGEITTDGCAAADGIDEVPVASL
jgi:hypothetical protein